MAVRVTSPVLVGRAGERRALADALQRAGDREPITVLVGGEAGIGKSRLIADLIETAREGGAIILAGSCVRLGDDEGLPFAPVAEALRRARRDLGAATIDALMDPATSELASLVPEFGVVPDTATLNTRPDWAQTRILEGLVTLLGRLGDRAPVLFVVEDLHWADQSTRDVIALLSRSFVDERVAIVATFRSDELHRRHPLRPWLAEMERSRAVVRLDLARLNRDEVGRLVEGITGEPPSAELVTVIVARSEGNPFFAEELLAAGITGHDDQLPVNLRDLLLVRVQALPDEAQLVLGCAAVAGQTFDHEALLGPCGANEAFVETGLREAISAQLIVAEPNARYTFRHALVQEAIYDDLLPRVKRGYHASYAEALSKTPVPDGALGASHLAALAHHASEAHDLPRALDGWIGAARASARVHALAESAEAYERALSLWDAVPEAERPVGVDLVQVLYEASLSMIGCGQLRRAKEVAAAAVTRFDPVDDPLRAALLRERYARTLWLYGNLTTALEQLEAAVELTRGSPATVESARVVASLAGTLVLRDHNLRAVEMGRHALALAREIGARSVEAYALCGLGVALVNRGEVDEGLDMLRTALSMARELELSTIDFHRTYANLSSCLESSGRIEEAVEVALEGVAWARRHGLWRLNGAFLEGNAASSLTEIGRWDEAWALLDRHDRPITEGVARLNHAVAAGPLAVRTGRLAEAQRLLVPAHEQVRELHDAQFSGPIYGALIELALAHDQVDDVADLADEAIASMGEVEEVGTRYRAEILALALRADARRLEAARARRDAPAIEAIREAATRRLAEVRVCAERPSGPVDGYGAETLGFVAMAEAEAHGILAEPDPERWAAAARAWSRIERPWPVAQARAREAEAILATRRSRTDALEPLQEAYGIALELGAAPLVAWCETLARMARLDLSAPASGGASDVDGVPAESDDGVDGVPDRAYGLTARELDVLQLLVAGYSNRQIGETLFVSESTAGVHVSNILGKLGVSNRVEAAAAAVRGGLTE